MKILRMKLTPRPESGMHDITWYSCPMSKATPEATLKHVQQIADKREIGVDYSLCSDLEYFLMRGARMWLLTAPGDFHTNSDFRKCVVHSGLVKTEDEVHTITTHPTDCKFTLYFTTSTRAYTLDTQHSTIKDEPLDTGMHLVSN